MSLSSGKSININLIKKPMNKYRTHNCSEVNEGDVNKTVSLSDGQKRDHGNLLFIDIEPTQCVIEIIISFSVLENLD